MKHPFVPALLATAALGAGSLAAQGHVWVVDDVAGPGIDFTSIQAAVDAAADGDTVLVRPGTYARFVVDGKGLSILASAATKPSVAASPLGVEVRNVPAQSVFVMRGIGLTGASFDPSVATQLLVEGCVGAVRIEHCTMSGFYQRTVIDQCAAVVLSHNSSTALIATDSALALDHCDFWGGQATPLGKPGLAGAECTRCVVSGRATDFTGGYAGPSSPDCTIPAGDGGDGLRLIDSYATLIACAGAGSFGGSSPGGACSGASGVGFKTTNSVLQFAPEYVSLHLDLPHGCAREGELVQMSAYGTTGDHVLLAYSTTPALLAFAGLWGPALVDPFAVTLIDLGVITGVGGKNFTFLVPELGPGISVTKYYIQAVFLKPSSIYLGDSVSLALLDAAY